MKDMIINTLIFVLFINLVMIIFPEGKTGKYCKIVIKLFLFIYIFNNLILKATISLDDIFELNFKENQLSSNNYEREIRLSESEKSFIAMINNDLYGGEEVIKDISLNFAGEMKLTVKVYINKILDIKEQDSLKNNISSIFNVSSENVEITF